MAILMRATTPEAGLYRLASPSGGGQPRYCTLGRRCVFRKWTSLGSIHVTLSRNAESAAQKLRITDCPRWQAQRISKSHVKHKKTEVHRNGVFCLKWHGKSVVELDLKPKRNKFLVQSWESFASQEIMDLWTYLDIIWAPLVPQIRVRVFCTLIK